MVNPGPDYVGTTKAWHVGFDVGKRMDYSAVAIARVIERPSPLDAKPETAYLVDTWQQLELGVNYMDQAKVLHALVIGLRERAIQERAGWNGFGEQPPLPAIRLYVDETGVGDSFCDTLERLLQADRATREVGFLPTRFVAGEGYRRVWERTRMRGLVGKGYLARQLVTRVKSRCVTVAGKIDARLIAEDELRVYEARMREEDGHTTYGAQQPGTHDDMLTALALAVLEGWNDYGVTYGKVVY